MTDRHTTITRRLESLRDAFQRSEGGPLYRQLTDRLRQEIRQGELAPGDPLPPQRRLSEILGLSEMTVRRAMTELAAAGLLEARRGSGTIVAGSPGPGRQGGEAAGEAFAARRLRVGVVFASLRDGYPFVEPMLTPLSDPATDTPLTSPAVRLQILHLDPAETDPQVILHQIPLSELDGLIMMSPVNVALLWLCQRRQVPYALCFNELADGHSRCVNIDYHPGLHAALGHLRAAGRQRPALVTAGLERHSAGQIADAFHLAAGLLGFAERGPCPVITAGYRQQEGYEATRRLLLAAPADQRPDALIFSSDHQACGGFVAAQELGLSIPGDLAIVGAGDLLDPGAWPMPLSTIDLKLSAMGHCAITAIHDQIAGRGEVPRRQILRSTFIPRATTPGTHEHRKPKDTESHAKARRREEQNPPTQAG